jgi:hypothetical protein
MRACAISGMSGDTVTGSVSGRDALSAPSSGTSNRRMPSMKSNASTNMARNVLRRAGVSRRPARHGTARHGTTDLDTSWRLGTITGTNSSGRVSHLASSDSRTIGKR